ncbi:hypothetical protein BYT27DRAFT_7337868 [Phlegmacium glaucopus]|nr:hypothetical protein BYT27DRAFT_7337868 [Phlegmacium glaucopus]
MEPEQPPAPPTPSLPAPGEPSLAEKLSLKRDFDRLFQKTLSDKKAIFAADGETEWKAALVELEEDLDNLGALVARLETRAAFGWNLRYTDMTPWVAKFLSSAQSSIVKRLKENMLCLHARIFELSLSTPLGYSEEDGSAGEEEEGEVESEEEEVVPVEPEVVKLNDPPVRLGRLFLGFHSWRLFSVADVPKPVVTVSLVLAQPITVVVNAVLHNEKAVPCTKGLRVQQLQRNEARPPS